MLGLQVSNSKIFKKKSVKKDIAVITFNVETL